MKNKKNRKLSATMQIGIALPLGIVAGLIANYFGIETLVINWISPIGDLFVKALKFIAMPLIIVSLLSGFTQLNDLSRLSKLGGRTIVAYLITTMLAVVTGLLLTNILQPGRFISDSTREKLLAQYPINDTAPIVNNFSLNFILDFIPENFFAAAANNQNMLQIIMVTILFAIATISVKEDTRKQLATLFNQLNEVVMKVIDFIMYLAPVGVFALMATVIVKAPEMEIIYALLFYALTVILGLSILVFIFYPLVVRRVNNIGYKQFLKGILPAQLLAISTSSSAATLPVTMDCVQNNLGVKKEVANFILPIGATLNMDGTSLYQAVAALFIAQVFGIDLSIMAQLTIVATATLASIGAAAVPGAGIIMLTIVLEQVGIPLAGLGLILALDRPLDMLRTAVNITSDAAIATVLSRTESTSSYEQTTIIEQPNF